MQADEQSTGEKLRHTLSRLALNCFSFLLSNSPEHPQNKKKNKRKTLNSIFFSPAVSVFANGLVLSCVRCRSFNLGKGGTDSGRWRRRFR